MRGGPHKGGKNMEKEKTKNVAETIGNLIINGYEINGGTSIHFGEWKKYVNIKLSKRYSYYGDDDVLRGFDESIEIDIASGEMTISHKAVEPYKRYRG